MKLTYEIRGFITVDVDTDGLQEAFILADRELCDTDFGKLENIEWDASEPIDIE